METNYSMNGMTWQDFVNSIREAGEPTPFKSKAQKRYKALRKKNDIYSSPAGHKNLAKSFRSYYNQITEDSARFYRWFIN